MSIKSLLTGVESKIKAPLAQLLSFIVQDAKTAASGNPMLMFLATDLEQAAADPALVSEIETMLYDLLLSKRNKAPAAPTATPAAPLTPTAAASPAPLPPAPIPAPAVTPVLEAPPVSLPSVEVPVAVPAPVVASAPVPVTVPETLVIRPL